MKKELKYLFLAGFMVFYLLNSCTPHLMETFRHFENATLIIGNIFRLIALLSIGFIPLILLYDSEKSLRINTTLVLPSTIISLFFIKSYFEITKANAYDITAYLLFNITQIALSIYFIIKYRKNLLIKPEDLTFFLAALVFLMPLNLFMNNEELINNKNFIYKNFGIFYFMFMVIFVLTSVILTKFLQKRENKEKILFFLSIVLVYHIFTRFSYVRLYDYQNAKGILGALPLYICSFGIMLLPFAIYSKNHFLQALSFLINTPGAIIVLVNPTTGVVGIFHYDVVYFFFSHILLFAVTIQLATYLNGKPNKRDVIHASQFLLGYFATMTVLNIVAESLSNNYNPNFSFVAISPLPVDMTIFGQFKVWKSTFTPVYILVLWLIHSALAFVAYLVYHYLMQLKNKSKPRKERKKMILNKAV